MVLYIILLLTRLYIMYMLSRHKFSPLFQGGGEYYIINYACIVRMSTYDL